MSVPSWRCRRASWPGSIYPTVVVLWREKVSDKSIPSTGSEGKRDGRDPRQLPTRILPAIAVTRIAQDGLWNLKECDVEGRESQWPPLLRPSVQLRNLPDHFSGRKIFAQVKLGNALMQCVYSARVMIPPAAARPA